MSEGRSSTGLGFYGAAFLVLLTLKLAGIGPVARWAWVWVTAPLWIPSAIAALVLGAMALRVALRAAGDRRKASASESRTRGQAECTAGHTTQKPHHAHVPGASRQIRDPRPTHVD